MNNTKRESSPVAIIFYALSVIFLAIFAFNIYYAYDYISGYDITFAEEWLAILSVYFTQTTPSFVGAVLFYGVGYMITQLQMIKGMSTATKEMESVSEVTATIEVEAESEELDFEELKAIVNESKEEKKEEVKEETKEEIKEEIKEEDKSNEKVKEEKETSTKKKSTKKKEDVVEGLNENVEENVEKTEE